MLATAFPLMIRSVLGCLTSALQTALLTRRCFTPLKHYLSEQSSVALLPITSPTLQGGLYVLYLHPRPPLEVRFEWIMDGFKLQSESHSRLRLLSGGPEHPWVHKNADLDHIHSGQGAPGDLKRTITVLDEDTGWAQLAVGDPPALRLQRAMINISMWGTV